MVWYGSTYGVSKKEVYIFSHRLHTSVFQIFGSNLRSSILTWVNLMFLFNNWNFLSNIFIIFTNLITSKTTKFEWVRIYSSIWSSWRCSESYADQFTGKMDDCNVKTLAKSFIKKQKGGYLKDLWKLKNEEFDKQIFHFIKICPFLLPCIWLELPTCASQKSESCKKYQIYSCQCFVFLVWAKHLKK